MGRRFFRALSLCLLLLGLGLLTVWLVGKGSFEDIYQRKVWENYLSVDIGRDILSLSTNKKSPEWKGDELLPPNLPLEAIERFLKCPSILEASASFNLHLHALGTLEGSPYITGSDTIATTPGMQMISNLEIIEGRFLTWEDVQEKRNVCVLDLDKFNELSVFVENIGLGSFLYFDNTLDEEGKLSDDPYEVVGIVKRHGLTISYCFIPISTGAEMINREFFKPNSKETLRYPNDFYFKVISTTKAVEEIEETVRDIFGGIYPYEIPTQMWAGVFFNPPKPFTNYELIRLRNLKYLFYRLPLIAFILISISVVFILWGKKQAGLKD